MCHTLYMASLVLEHTGVFVLPLCHFRMVKMKAFKKCTCYVISAQKERKLPSIVKILKDSFLVLSLINLGIPNIADLIVYKAIWCEIHYKY